MSENFDPAGDFQRWEYERRKDLVDQDFENAYSHSPEYALHADMKAAFITDAFMRDTDTTDQDSLGRIQMAMKKVGFMFSNNTDPLDDYLVLPVLHDRYLRNGQDMAATADAAERYVTYLSAYWKQTAEQAGDAWMDYSSNRAWNEATALMEAHVEADFGETDI